MVDNQHKKISGYRDLSEAEIALMNECKATEKQVLDLVRRVQLTGPEIDGRWCAIAKTNLEQGFMALVRSIARPNS